MLHPLQHEHVGRGVTTRISFCGNPCPAVGQMNGYGGANDPSVGSFCKPVAAPSSPNKKTNSGMGTCSLLNMCFSRQPVSNARVAMFETRAGCFGVSWQVDQAMEAIAEIHGQHPKNIGRDAWLLGGSLTFGDPTWMLIVWLNKLSRNLFTRTSKS